MNAEALRNSAVDLLDDLIARYPPLEECRRDIVGALNLLVECFKSGRKLLVCGNGGSAADSEHIVGELMKSFRFRRSLDSSFLDAYRELNGCDAPNWLEGSLPAIALVSHTALSTAFGNDEDVRGLFAQQVYGYGKKDDILLAISTSGSSPNVVEAARVAYAKGLRVIALTGSRKTELSEKADVAIMVPERETYKVQELHLPVYHCLCAMVEQEIFGE